MEKKILSALVILFFARIENLKKTMGTFVPFGFYNPFHLHILI